jgi:hypothetical protein
MRAFLLLLLLAPLTGCATAGSPAAGGGSDRPITLETIQQSSYSNAFQLVQTERPGWLRPRGRSSVEANTGVRVYVNGMLRGGVRSLRQMPISEVREIRYYGSHDATTRFGTGNPQGAIEVIM